MKGVLDRTIASSRSAKNIHTSIERALAKDTCFQRNTIEV